MKIGLLGGSFNPAHAGHVHLSCEARKRLGLHQVWWILSPQNPLKSSSEIAAYALRLRKAREVARRHPFIKICEVEQRRGTRYTLDTLRLLKRQYPAYQFAWMMGADNLQQFHRWHRWRDIFRLMPIAVFEREIGGNALHSKAARQFASYRREPRSLLSVQYSQPSKARRAAGGNEAVGACPHQVKLPCWAYVFMAKHPESATRLRNMLGMEAFLGHNERR